MSASPDDAARHASTARFRARRSLLVTELRSLLGPHALVAPVDEPQRASAVHAEYRASEREAEPQDWSLARRSWPLADLDEMVDALHRLSRHLAGRAGWLILPEREPQACELSLELPLDNPMGFAALAGHELLLMDLEVPAGLWLCRHAHAPDGEIEYEWELVVWGEPWLSATTRALRGAD